MIVSWWWLPCSARTPWTRPGWTGSSRPSVSGPGWTRWTESARQVAALAPTRPPCNPALCRRRRTASSATWRPSTPPSTLASCSSTGWLQRGREDFGCLHFYTWSWSWSENKYRHRQTFGKMMTLKLYVFKYCHRHRNKHANFWQNDDFEKFPQSI